MKDLRKRYRLLSPDGIIINPNIGSYKSREQMMSDYNKWIERFKQQGYYSTFINGKKEHIPLELLFNYCRVETLYLK